MTFGFGWQRADRRLQRPGGGEAEEGSRGRVRVRQRKVQRPGGSEAEEGLGGLGRRGCNPSEGLGWLVQKSGCKPNENIWEKPWCLPYVNLNFAAFPLVSYLPFTFQIHIAVLLQIGFQGLVQLAVAFVGMVQ